MVPDKVDAKMVIITILTGACLFFAGFAASQLTLGSKVAAHEVQIEAIKAEVAAYKEATADTYNRLSTRMDKLIEQNTQLIMLLKTTIE